MGDGAMWADTARSLGYWVDNNPHIGDVMVFQRGQEGASSTYGHVAIVEKVNTDGSVTTSESGASLNGGTISRTFTNVHDFQYIHF
jgi:surface antigen